MSPWYFPLFSVVNYAKSSLFQFLQIKFIKIRTHDVYASLIKRVLVSLMSIIHKLISLYQGEVRVRCHHYELMTRRKFTRHPSFPEWYSFMNYSTDLLSCVIMRSILMIIYILYRWSLRSATVDPKNIISPITVTINIDKQPRYSYYLYILYKYLTWKVCAWIDWYYHMYITWTLQSCKIYTFVLVYNDIKTIKCPMSWRWKE